MTIKTLALMLLGLTAGMPTDNEPKVTAMISREMPDISGKEGVLLTVEYPPGGADPAHRHHAHAFVYVLEGSIVMQVQGQEEVTLTPGQTFYEGPNDVHVVGRNASQTEPAKFLVFRVKKKDAPILIPDEGATHKPASHD